MLRVISYWKDIVKNMCNQMPIAILVTLENTGVCLLLSNDYIGHTGASKLIVYLHLIVHCT